MGPDWWLAPPWRTAWTWLRHHWRRADPDWTPLDEGTTP